MTVRHRVAPGTATAIVSEAGVVLVDLPVESGMVETFERYLAGAIPVDALLAELLADGVGHIPSFCLADLRGERVRVLVRGSGVVGVSRDGEEVKIDGGDVTLWREEFIVLPGQLTLAIGAVAPGVGYWVGEGVIPASAVYLELGQAVSKVQADQNRERAVPVAGGPPTEPMPLPPPATLAWGSEPAAASEVAAPPPVEPQPTQPPAPPPALAPPTSPSAQDSSGLIDGIPDWLKSGSAAPTQVPTPQPAPPAPSPTSQVVPADSHFTEYRPTPSPQTPETAETQSTVARPPRPLAVPGGLSGIRCASGHANPLGAAQCRACRQPINDRAPVVVAPAEVGVLRFSDGREVNLASPVVIGRMPTAEPINGKTPSLVTIDDPQLSRRHASVWADGWSVAVVDHGSTNKTMVSFPGAGVAEVTPNEPTPLPVGAVVDLGGVLTFRLDAS